MKACKVLTVCQPYATMLFLKDQKDQQIKQYETRPQTCTWLNYRGPLYIHAGLSKSYMKALSVQQLERIFEKVDYSIFDLPFGAIIGKAEMICVYGTGSMPRDMYENEEDLGDFSPGRVAIVLANRELFDKPIPAKGKQGLWIWNDSEYQCLYHSGICQHGSPILHDKCGGCPDNSSHLGGDINASS